MVPHTPSSDALPVTWRHKCYIWKNFYNSFFLLRLKVKTKIIQDFGQAQLSTNLSIFLSRNWQKTSLTCVTMVTKIVTCYFSVVNICSQVDFYWFLLIIDVFFARHNRVHVLVSVACVCVRIHLRFSRSLIRIRWPFEEIYLMRSSS